MVAKGHFGDVASLQGPVGVAVDGVPVEALDIGAVVKYISAEGRETCRDSDRLEAQAVVECLATDALDSFGDDQVDDFLVTQVQVAGNLLRGFISELNATPTRQIGDVPPLRGSD